MVKEAIQRSIGIEEASTIRHTCTVCKKEYDENLFYTEQNKCILHCRKTEDNGWYKLDNQNEKDWNIDKVNLFWRYVQNELVEISDAKVDQEKETIHKLIYLHVVFPKHEKDYDDTYHPVKDHISDLGTNFYAYFQYKNEKGDIDDMYKMIEDLQIKFIDCTFLDVVDFRRYTFNQALLFINCTFERKILLGNIFTNKLSFKKCNFTNNILYLNNKTFNDKFEIKRCIKISDLWAQESTFGHL